MKNQNNFFKNLGKAALVASVLFITSCGSDDAQDLIDDVACENQTLASKLNVEAAITAYNANQNQGTCESLRQLIEVYRDFDCIADDVFATEYDALPADCADAGAGN
ncbi:hypothetical protein [uncultured Aquimarina sp.]|uniref:hypothetical protein n=1 Tax=uncultured Aquimarina sp. TaxID=575652 RepID=UPI0026315D48|nr:hypothetical protein [uncultured Aquimarina sp.]